MTGGRRDKLTDSVAMSPSTDTNMAVVAVVFTDQRHTVYYPRVLARDKRVTGTLIGVSGVL